MKVKELIEELQKFNPDGTVEVEVLSKWNVYRYEGYVEEVESADCAMINPRIISRE